MRLRTVPVPALIAQRSAPLALALIAPAAAMAVAAFPPPLPKWNARRVATLAIRGQEEPHFEAAQLDGRGGEELVAVADTPNAREMVRQVTVYTWRGGRFAPLASSRVSLRWPGPAHGDLDGDGRDELYAVGPENGIRAFRLEGNRLTTSAAARPGNRLIVSLAVSDFRSPGRTELLIAVDSRRRFNNEDVDPQAHLLLGFRPGQGAWKQTFRAPISQKRMTLEIHSGDYLPAPGTELVFEHGPSDVSDALFEAWRWEGGRLKRAGAFVSDAGKSGLQSWRGVAGGLSGSGRSIVAHTVYFRSGSDGETGATRGELVQWDGPRPRARFALPGEPRAVGRFTAPGRPGILIRHEDGSFALYES